MQGEFSGNLLPTSNEVLRLFFHYHKTMQETVAKSAQSVAEDVTKIWNNARIPTKYQPDIVSKIKCLFDEYTNIKKNKGRGNNKQRLKEQEFKENGNKLFDIAHQDANELIKIEEDRTFLDDQRGRRQMKMSGVDKILSEREKRSHQRRQKEIERKQLEESRTKIRNEVSDESEDQTVMSEGETNGSDNDYEIEIPLYYKKQIGNQPDSPEDIDVKQPRIIPNMLSSSDVSSALDRINLSDRKFTLLAAAIAKASGQELTEVSLSRSTVRRKRLHNRSNINSNIRERFHAHEKSHLVVHWDGKIMKDTTASEEPLVPHSTTERLAVVVTGCNVEKIPWFSQDLFWHWAISSQGHF